MMSLCVIQLAVRGMLPAAGLVVPVLAVAVIAQCMTIPPGWGQEDVLLFDVTVCVVDLALGYLLQISYLLRGE